MIYLFDDSSTEYISQFFDLSSKLGSLELIQSISYEDVISCRESLLQADCILIHRSFKDAKSKDSRDVFDYVVYELCDEGKRLPLVIFSNGDPEFAEFKGLTCIRKLKKDKLYLNISDFLDDYSHCGSIDLAVLANGKQTGIDKHTKDCIVFIGSENIKPIADTYGATYIPFPDVINLDDSFVHDYMFECLNYTSHITTIVIEMESNPSFCLSLAMHIRLSLETLGRQALCGIILLGYSTLEHLKQLGQCAQILMTESVYLVSTAELESTINNARSININNYNRDFLSRISIKPDMEDEYNSHGLANEWGANVILRLTPTSNEIRPFVSASKRLYFKYVTLTTSDDLQSILFPQKLANEAEKISIPSQGKKILLIDDMADRGWELALRQLMPGADINVICERVSNVESFSDKAKELLNAEGYDLYLLDLRMSGNNENDIYDPNAFSGMKVLKYIKKKNFGNQVIMFTASNKVWNYKSLLESTAGANGYYIKESPTFMFPMSFSFKNLNVFKSEVLECYSRKYLKDFFVFKESLLELDASDTFISELKIQMDMAFELAYRATNAIQYRYAFISLAQAFEIIAKNNIKTYNSRARIATDFISEPVYHIMANAETDTFVSSSEEFIIPKGGNISLFDRIAAIYFQVIMRESSTKADNGILYLIQQAIYIRNKIIHPNTIGENNYEYSKSNVMTVESFEKKYRNSLPIYSTVSFADIFTELAEKGFLRESINSRHNSIIIDKACVDDKVGIEFIFNVIKRLISHM